MKIEFFYQLIFDSSWSSIIYLMDCLECKVTRKMNSVRVKLPFMYKCSQYHPLVLCLSLHVLMWISFTINQVILPLLVLAIRLVSRVSRSISLYHLLQKSSGRGKRYHICFIFYFWISKQIGKRYQLCEVITCWHSTIWFLFGSLMEL